ncbi:phosphate regulon transcriptional regulator PhoB [Arenicella xantha]|uniref:Phosphate regulon transcriptional regulatory protein PhoB n=1 Tax=Arenicella xantha TaxID=644221 RepID=A0A395JQB1_9GAMM|nr:phosphate regulon transcriptional regulator PhoB [Arenicella xantha]RBP50900.1 winged helix family two component transcriptional regulator [Arenicella xantha]
MTHHILIVDDEAAIRDMVRMALEIDGFTVSDASNAHQAAKLLEEEEIDLLLLDWMMPGISGIDFAGRIRREGNHQVGIIMLTAKDDEADMVRGLDVGADDYVKKPFSTKELLSRINAVLRRLSSGHVSGDVVSAGKITIDSEQHRVLIDGNNVDFSPTEFRLLHFLLTHPDRVFARDQLLDNVWGNQVYVEDRTVDVHIRRLRKVLEPCGCDDYINTVRGVGYRFSLPAL